MVKNPFNIIYHIILFSIFVKSGSSSIDCYTCTSKNGTDEYCEDAMAPAFVPLEIDCSVPKPGHIGKFPASFCVKMVGTSVENGETLVVRTCVLEDIASGGSQCGNFRFQGNPENDTQVTVMSGCILTCDYDGCNNAKDRHGSHYCRLFLLFIINVLSYIVSTYR